MARRLAAVGLVALLVSALGGSTYSPDTGSYKTTTMRRGAASKAAAPGSFAAAVSYGEIALSWDAVAGATGYNVYRRSLPGESWYPLYTATVGDTVPGMDFGVDYQDHAFFYASADSVYHVISINGPDWQTTTDGEAFRHISSRDLVNWTTHTSIDRTDLAGASTEIDGYDVSKVWAPAVVEDGGTWYMFFTGVDRESYPADNSRIIQRIFVATADTSADLTDPTVWSDASFVLNGYTGSIATLAGMSAPAAWDTTAQYSANCRDPWVVYDAAGGQWVMTYTGGGSANGAEAVNMATAPSPAGPWTKRGYVTATNGSKAESSSLVFSELLDSWLLMWVDGLKTAWDLGEDYHGPYQFTASGFPYIANALLEPLPISGAMRVKPYSTDAVETWAATSIFWGSDNNHILPRVLAVHADSSVISSKLYLADVVDVGSVAATAYSDTTVYGGATYDYSIAAVVSGKEGSRALVDSVYYYDEIVATDVTIAHAQLAGKVSATVTIDANDGPYDWRYRYTITATEDTASLSSATFTEWTSSPRYNDSFQQKETYELIQVDDTGLDVGDWFNFEFQAVMPGDPATYSLSEIATFQRLSPPANITDVAATQSGSNVVLTWTASSDPYFDHYRIEVTDLSTSQRSVVETSWASAGYTHVSPGSGMYIYWVIVVRESGQESSDSNGAFISVSK